MFPLFKRHEILEPKNKIPRLFSAIFPNIHDFSRPENAFSNSMTFRDFSWPYEALYAIDTLTNKLRYVFALLNEWG